MMTAAEAVLDQGNVQYAIASGHERR